jgi:hypothetical protein
MAYRALVEKQFGHQIQRLRTYNGGEYVNNNFTSYYTTHGIQMQHIVPYTPHQNGVVERKNHTLKEMANCMIQSKGLSLKYWEEAIKCENYIVNHTPTKALKNIRSEEAWTKIKPDVSHFHVFGNVAWAHIPDEKRKALQPKSEKCIFVGYYEDVKGYKNIDYIVVAMRDSLDYQTAHAKFFSSHRYEKQKLMEKMMTESCQTCTTW